MTWSTDIHFIFYVNYSVKIIIANISYKRKLIQSHVSSAKIGSSNVSIVTRNGF
jgi:hypothetical protein